MTLCYHVQKLDRCIDDGKDDVDDEQITERGSHFINDIAQSTLAR